MPYKKMMDILIDAYIEEYETTGTRSLGTTVGSSGYSLTLITHRYLQSQGALTIEDNIVSITEENYKMLLAIKAVREL